MENNFDLIRKEGRLLMEFVRGSHLYNLNTKDSDVDTGGVFICRPEQCVGNLHKVTEVADAKHDNTWYELNNFVHLATKSNPTVLEALFVPNDKIIGGMHPYILPLIENNTKFITKKCFSPFFGYAKAQIEKARGLNKKITNPITERKTPIDFCYTIKENGGGTENLSEFLTRNGLKIKHCGAVALDHMHDVYSIFYDFGAHINEDGVSRDEFMTSPMGCLAISTYANLLIDSCIFDGLYDRLKCNQIGYAGILNEDMTANQLRLSSVPKGEKPIAVISYNMTGYSKHCREYKEYQEWVKNRNPVRYESNLGKNYDSKNMMHCFRLIHMAQEIASGQGIMLDRGGIDREFLLDVRNHRYEYDEIISMLEDEREKMNSLMESSTIPDDIDVEFVNDILIGIRKEQFKEWVR